MVAADTWSGARKELLPQRPLDRGHFSRSPFRGVVLPMAPRPRPTGLTARQQRAAFGRCAFALAAYRNGLDQPPGEYELFRLFVERLPVPVVTVSMLRAHSVAWTIHAIRYLFVERPALFRTALGWFIEDLETGFTRLGASG